MTGSIPYGESITAFKERLRWMITAICAEEFAARPSYMACRNRDYTDLCGAGEKGSESSHSIPNTNDFPPLLET
jgi:hypothetical protein